MTRMRLFMDTLAETIKSLRIAKQMSQAELGDVLGVTRAAVYQWEKGKAVPQIDYLREMSRFFGVPLATLIGDASAGQSVDAALQSLQPAVAEALRASFLSTIENLKAAKK